MEIVNIPVFTGLGFMVNQWKTKTPRVRPRIQNCEVSQGHKHNEEYVC